MPKKGAKKGGGKQAGMTEEERLLYMQQRAQAEEEMAKRKEDMLTQFLRDKLQKEERNSVVNQHKLTQQWRAVLRQTRAAELRAEIDVFSQTFERVLDRKDSVIKCLVCDLSEAEQQLAQANRSHLHCLDYLLALQTGRLASLKQHWSSSLEELTSEFNIERERILSQHQRECVYLEDVTFAMEQYYTEQDGEGRQDYQSTIDEIKNRSIEEKHALRMQLEGEVEGLWDHFQRAKCSYNEATEDRHIAFESLRTHDQHSSEEIDTQARKLQKLQDTVSALRSKLNSIQKESAKVTQDLRTAREEVTLQTYQLKGQLSRTRTAKRTQLTNLTVHSDAATKKLLGIIAKGERLLRMAEMCRKLETEHEKVLPFYTSSLTAEEESQERANVMEPPSEALAQVQRFKYFIILSLTHACVLTLTLCAKAMLDYSVVERFWQRYNKVLLERLCLEQERGALTEENQQLRGLLRQYLDSISVSDEALGHHSPLLMVSQPALTAPPTVDTQPRHHTVVEAAHIVQNIR
ncbi:dynein regulatory complex subunit 2 isoform X1 [Esox lucius]|uniref:Dynein regulatory complex protein 1 n=1 Tax=Esox lucius TaxID=8010 RepID=A0A3P8YJS9_ESOLU|nr:dynein regulatory complex subunit 2 isoform X1 [Esox lucius]XP_019910711.2 dynein regulatory complex subunit 2 isoform X1 [Esox lucius]XP_019910712.2 dynein regulatory complex subunit 2 isoform X1 [Esox lucius]XP_019910713.2 dynein regulatory complex subunit 2 isoform X1 [Esox lucius]XP_034143426.1 dynein regulatory complex subunit 2 isoform X1 [Esox lucius]